MKLGRTYRNAGLRNRDHLPRLERLCPPRTRPYDLRHFHATFLVAEGIDYRMVGDRLGHKSASFTLSRYVHASARGQQPAADAASELLMKIARV
jgi:integrase